MSSAEPTAQTDEQSSTPSELSDGSDSLSSTAGENKHWYHAKDPENGNSNTHEDLESTESTESPDCLDLGPPDPEKFWRSKPSSASSRSKLLRFKTPAQQSTGWSPPQDPGSLQGTSQRSGQWSQSSSEKSLRHNTEDASRAEIKRDIRQNPTSYIPPTITWMLNQPTLDDLGVRIIEDEIEKFCPDQSEAFAYYALPLAYHERVSRRDEISRVADERSKADEARSRASRTQTR